MKYAYRWNTASKITGAICTALLLYMTIRTYLEGSRIWPVVFAVVLVLGWIDAWWKIARYKRYVEAERAAFNERKRRGEA